MHRGEIVQSLIDLYDDPAYLEIGDISADAFLGLKAARKVAVQSTFGFDVASAQSGNPTATFHAMESDAYFGDIVGRAETFHVIALTGPHALDQTLRDFCNAIAYLAPGGAIVINGVSPGTYEASIAKEERAERTIRRARDGMARGATWVGDAYRVVFFIETFFQGWSLATVEESGDDLVVWRAARRGVPDRLVEQIARLPFEVTTADRNAYHGGPLGKILGEIGRARR